MYSERVIKNPNNTSTNLPDSYEYTYGINQEDGTLGTAEGQRYNREYTIPQSVFSSASPMRNATHFVIHTDKYINRQRGNLPHGIVNSSLQYDEYSNGTRGGESINSGVAAGFLEIFLNLLMNLKGILPDCTFMCNTLSRSNSRV